MISLARDAPDSKFDYGESGFESIGGWEVEVGAEISSLIGSKDESNDINKASVGPDRHRLISMLSSIILPNEKDKVSFELSVLEQSKTAVNAFLDFMARYLTRGLFAPTKQLHTLLFPPLQAGSVRLCLRRANELLSNC